MQENNNFQKIISQWRRMSGEQVELTALISMSGDSHHTSKKDEIGERDLLVPEGSKLPLAAAGATATAAIVEPAITNQPEEKQEFLDQNKDDERKEVSGDTQCNDKSSDRDYLEHNDSTDKLPVNKTEKEKGDNVDSVYLRPPPPHKARSNASSPQEAEEEDCGIKCLYYTLQCCDCVLM